MHKAFVRLIAEITEAKSSGGKAAGAAAKAGGRWITYNGRKIFLGKDKDKFKNLSRSAQQKEWHQTGFNGQKIAKYVIEKKLGFKGVTYMKHKDPVDVSTSNTGWEVKTFDIRFADHIQMGVSATQKVRKEQWSKKNKKKLKSMLVLVNSVAEIYMKDGVGKFRPGGMKKVASIKDWRKTLGVSTRKRYTK